MNFWLTNCLTAVLAAALLGCGGSSSTPSGASSVQSELAAAKAESNPFLRARSLVEIAERQRQANDVTGAEATLALAVDASREVTEPADRATRQAEVAMAYARGGSQTEAKRVATAAVESAAAVKEDTARLGALIAAADAQAQAKDRNGAAKSVREAETLLETLKPADDADVAARDRVERLLGVAQVHQKLGRTDEVKRLVGTVRQMIDGITQPRKKCDSLAVLAVAQFGMQLPEADATVQAAIDVLRKIEDPLSKAHGFCDLAQRLREASRADKTSALLQEAEQVAGQVEGPKSLTNELEERIRRLKG